nr:MULTISPECIES: decaprenylphospho-beta-D-erythro-pentofuranosid-2-ulose 2-reductase [unclassified Actinopolyspora]
MLGGTSDIALATAEQYARKRPLRIVLAARPSERLEEAAERLRGTGSTVTTVPFDARDPDSHADTLDKAFADGDIDISLVAFGMLGDQEKLWTDVEAAREMAEINYVAPVTVGVLLAERMRKQGHGHIVALSSVAGERVRRSNFAYGSSKAGMDGFYTGLTEALRPSGVKVTVVRPGHVKSKMTEGMKEAPLAQTPEQVAGIIVDSVRKGKELVWAPAQFRYVMSVLRHLPRVVFRRLPF